MMSLFVADPSFAATSVGALILIDLYELSSMVPYSIAVN